MLEINHLSVNLNSTRILNDITFQARKGEILGIIGPNGAGKSTLLRAINGLLPLTHGTIWLDEKSLGAISPLELSKLIASVPQVAQLPAGYSVQDVVLMGRTPYLNWFGQTTLEDEEFARSAMQQTQTIEYTDRMINQLSAGEQQRVLLARALTQSTPVILMDEPTAHLDLHFQIELLELIHQLVSSQQLIALLVMHDLNLASRYAHRILLLNHGRSEAFGLPSRVLQPGVLSRVFQLPIKVERGNKTYRIFPA